MTKADNVKMHRLVEHRIKPRGVVVTDPWVRCIVVDQRTAYGRQEVRVRLLPEAGVGEWWVSAQSVREVHRNNSKP